MKDEFISKIGVYGQMHYRYLKENKPDIGVITVTKETIPVQGVAAATTNNTKTVNAVTGITVNNNKITPTVQPIDLKSYPQAVEVLTIANGAATLSQTPVGNVQVMLNGVAQTLGTDYSVSGTTVTIETVMGYAAGDVVTAVYNYAG